MKVDVMEDGLHLDSREPGPQHHPVLCDAIGRLFQLCVNPRIFDPDVCDPGHRRPNIRDANVILRLLHFRGGQDFPTKPTLKRQHNHGATISRMYPAFDPGTGVSPNRPMHVFRCHLLEIGEYPIDVHRELRCSRVGVSIWVWRARRPVGNRHRPGMGLL